MNERAWIELSSSEEDKIWASVYERLGFKPSVHEKDFPGFKEPTPSVTYSFRDIWGDDFLELNADLNEKAHAIIRSATTADAFVYALDWQHQGYKFYPDRAGSAGNDEWIIPALPDGDYHLFVEKSLAFGWLGHPWEQTICVFGQPLLVALKNNRPKVFRNPIRRRDPF